MITVDPEENPAEFLQALPASERECLEQAVGPDKLEEFIADADPGTEPIQACVSEETVRSVTLGGMAREAGELSDQTITCLLEKTESVHFLDLFSQEEIGPEFGTVMQAMSLCLSDEELVGSQQFGSEDQPLTAEQLRCLFSADPEELGQQGPEVVELLKECGIPLGMLEESGGPPAVTAEQGACLIEAIGEQALEELRTGQRSPTSDEVDAFVGCGVGGPDHPPEGLVAPDPLSLPKAVAPGGLGGVQLPEDDAGIASLFELLPTEVAGLVRSGQFEQGGPGERRATYGVTGGQDCSPLSLQARDLSTGDFFPPSWTADVFISFWSLGEDWEVEAVGRDGGLYWVQWNTTCSNDPSSEESPVYGISWGTGASLWVFLAQAGTPEELDALVAAFVAAAGNLEP